MRNLQILIIIGLLLACNRTDTKSIYEKYVDAYYHQGFESVSDLLADTIVIKDIEDYEVQYSKQNFEEYYQWDSVFKPIYELINLTYTDSTVDVIQIVSSKRYDFLDNNPLKTRKRIHFENGKIVIIENLEYLNVNWDIWIAKRDSLVKWIDNNHNELSGFVYDMTKKGAENYLKAMELYKTHCNKVRQ